MAWRTVRLGLLCALVGAGAGCSSADGPRAVFGDGSWRQTAVFEKIFDTQGALADVRIVTEDRRERKDEVEWCTILHFHEGQYMRFEYRRSRRYQFGADRLRHYATYAWPVDLDENPENRSLFLVEVRAAFPLVEPEGAVELVSLSTTAYLVRRMKALFMRKEATDEEVLRCVDLALRAQAAAEEDPSWAERVRTGYLRFARAQALSRMGKDIDAAVGLQEMVSSFELAEAPPPEDRPRQHLANADYLVLAARRLIDEIKGGGGPAKAPAEEPGDGPAKEPSAPGAGGGEAGKG